MKKQTVTVRVNNEHLAKTLNVKVGEKVKVELKGGVPLNREWRNRFKDANIDDCITISENVKAAPAKPIKEDGSK